MSKLSIFGISGDQNGALTCDQGRQIGELILKAKEHPVQLSFEGIQVVTSVFLSELIDVLRLSGIEEKEIPNIVIVIDDYNRKFLFDRCVEHLYDYWRRPEFHQTILKEIDDYYS